MAGQADPTPVAVAGWRVLAVIAAGGALGSAARYGLTVAWPTPTGGLPWATLVTNLIGCLLLGALLRIITRHSAPHHLIRPFAGTGLLGGFTTFSTYAVETRALLGAGQPGLAAGYVVGTLVGALGAVLLGHWLVNRVTGS
ncbi:fluoride efflux transporter CrcB [Solwaraspora sp. WMMD1047]|uniref:fluoride efflux transporter CrcB n=1 Tax=Solwaraspora sp. WMMD1047 TaxID=3016102 RepID=UPI0024169A1A|nr:fluoride efflux transporter CrcB [Solwaraspora sp. WMMD1047]MDG4834770.1 fluoride efflux transporter CrcB [Solwaraspora sp. WMMD1047]